LVIALESGDSMLSLVATPFGASEPVRIGEGLGTGSGYRTAWHSRTLTLANFQIQKLQPAGDDG